METSHLSELTQDADSLRQFHQAELLLDVSTLIYSTMKEKRVSRAHLAKKLGVTKGRVTQILDGTTNLTLRTVADIFSALDCQFYGKVKDLAEQTGWFGISAEAQIHMRPKYNLNLDECFNIDVCEHKLAS